MAGRGPRPRAAISYIPWGKSSHRGLQLAERTTRIHADDAGCGPGLAAGRHQRDAGLRGTGGAGAGGAAALVVNQARTQLYATHHGGAGGGPDIEEPADGVMSRQLFGRNSDSDGRNLRSAGLVQHARPHHSTAAIEQGERWQAGRGWIVLKADTHGGPGRAGP